MTEEVNSRLRRIEQQLKKLLPEPTAEWLDYTAFKNRTNLTKEKIRGLREKYPEMVKGKPRSNRYLFNWNKYEQIFLRA